MFIKGFTRVFNAIKKLQTTVSPITKFLGWYWGEHFVGFATYTFGSRANLINQ